VTLNRKRIVRLLSTPSCVKVFTKRPKRSFLVMLAGSMTGCKVAGVDCQTEVSQLRKEDPRHRRNRNRAKTTGIKHIVDIRPKLAWKRSPKRNSLCTPKFTPHTPGPISKFRFANLWMFKQIGTDRRQGESVRIPDLIAATVLVVSRYERAVRRIVEVTDRILGSHANIAQRNRTAVIHRPSKAYNRHRIWQTC